MISGIRKLFAFLIVACATGAALAGAPAAQASCDAPANEIEAENCQPGAPQSRWDIAGVGDARVQGFATDISVDQGARVTFKIDSSVSYGLEIYRLGWYGGSGARRVDSATPTARNQPSCMSDGGTGLVDCGNWLPSAAWDVPANATSGIYLAVATVNGAPASHIPFVVRDDDGGSDLLFQTSDTTWQAYNRYGGSSLYVGAPAGRAYKVSYNRPFTTAAYAVEDWLFNAEYPMVRWLERNGYDVSYSTGVDSDRLGGEIAEHRAFLSVGHDEYWSGGQRANVEAARDAGVNLAFFSGNEVFWKTRWEDGHRTLVSYKETHAGAKIDPTGTWTGTWRDPRPFNPEGANPENALTGQLFMVNDGATTAIQVPSDDGKMRFWRNTSVAGLAPDETAVLTPGTLGYEWDVDTDNGVRPAGSVRLSSTTRDGAPVLVDHGSTFGSGTAEHNLTLYRDTNGAGPDALVFGAGTIQWSWGLDDLHERGSDPPSPAMQQATANLFADMGAQPASLQSDLQPASPSSDTRAPSETIDGPATISVSAGVEHTIRGTASDEGGGRVGAVEVSTDGGQSWHPASGRERWSYTWTPSADGAVTPLVRASDDSANLVDGDPLGGASGGASSPPAGGRGFGSFGGDGGGGGQSSQFQSGRKVALGPERARMSRRGRVRVLVACPSGKRDCRVKLSLKRRGRLLARRTVTVRHGDDRSVALQLNRSTRLKVIRRGSLRVNAIAKSGGRATRTSIRILAPRSRP